MGVAVDGSGVVVVGVERGVRGGRLNQDGIEPGRNHQPLKEHPLSEAST